MRKIIEFAYLILFITFTIPNAFANGVKTEHDTLVPYTATYAMKKKGSTIAELSYELKQEQGQWILNTFAKPKGLAAMLTNQTITEKSVMALNADIVQPISYSRTPSNVSDVKNLQQKIEYQHKQAQYSKGDSSTTLALKGTTYDSLSLQTAFMLDAMQHKNSVAYQVIDDGQIETQQYQKSGKETVTTRPNTHYETIKYTRQYGNKEIHMWFASEYNYLLVKMQKFRKGKLKSELVLTKSNIQ